jgi:hypothetical protein
MGQEDRLGEHLLGGGHAHSGFDAAVAGLLPELRVVRPPGSPHTPSRPSGGLNLDDLGEFLASRSREPLPQAVEVLLADLGERSGRLRDHGLARLVEC